MRRKKMRKKPAVTDHHVGATNISDWACLEKFKKLFKDKGLLKKEGVDTMIIKQNKNGELFVVQEVEI